MKYIYCHQLTRGTTGFFSCEPEGKPGLSKCLDSLELNRDDNFLHKYIFSLLEKLSEGQLLSLVRLCKKSGKHPGLSALLLEYHALKRNVDLSHLNDLEAFAHELPVIYLAYKSQSNATREIIRMLGRVFISNMEGHIKIPDLSGYNFKNMQNGMETVSAKISVDDSSLSNLYKMRSRNSPAPDIPQDISDNLRIALDALEKANILAGPEMRHEKSLSPIGLLRQWHISSKIDDGLHQSELYGTGTSYGKGLTIPAARLSLAMEIVERASAYVDIGQNGTEMEVNNRRAPMPLIVASLADLKRDDMAYAFPRSPYPRKLWQKRVLHWVEGYGRNGRRVLVPAQAVFLFCNLFEPPIFETLGSTGLGAGFSTEYACLSGLLETVERDAAATTPFHPSTCFRIRSRDKRIQGLLDDYSNQGIDVQVQDITTETGPPVYRCFVIERDGKICQASAASLDGKKAVLGALTETPWEYAYGRIPGKPSLKGPGKLPILYLEDLPNYDLGSISENLALVEDSLASLGLEPIYVDITRNDLDLPVVRTIVPQLEITADFDDFIHPSARLLHRQQKLFGNVTPN